METLSQFDEQLDSKDGPKTSPVFCIQPGKVAWVPVGFILVVVGDELMNHYTYFPWMS